MGTAMTNRKQKKSRPLSETAVRQIGEKLRENYDQILNEPVPDRFAALLEELEKSERKDEPQ